MGIRGLTTFIANNSERYFDIFELHDCSLVVDGNSLSSLLYNLHAKCVCAFGGDYDRYAHCVASFFLSLKKAGVRPLVIFDGGYETRKLKTVMKRLKDKIRLAKTITPISSKYKYFPLLMKEVFKDVVLELGIPLAQCFFEADDEIAAIARQLNCPVLSYDSDFFVYDVFYIPFDTMDITPLRRKGKPVQNSDFFISCQIYNVENFLSHFGGSNKSMVPLMATLLGNDYVERRTFKRFYASLKRGKRKSSGLTQRRIAALLNWLKQWDDVNSAVTAVLSYLKKERRQQISTIIQRTVAGYTQCSSQLLPTLGLSKDTAPETLSITRYNSLPIEFSESDDDETSDNEPSISNYSSDDVDEDWQESSSAQQEKVESDVEDEQENKESNEENDEDEESEDIEEDEEDEEEDGNEDFIEEEKEDEVTGFHSKAFYNRAYFSVERLPSWFKDLFCHGFLPSYFIDMLTLRTYFCSPQVEDYHLLSSHEISIPILEAIYSIIASAQRNPKPMKYFLRNIYHQPQKSFLVPLEGVYPTLTMLGEMKISERQSILMTSLGLKEKDLTAIDCFPSEWRLFIACVVSWGRNCHTPSISNCHIHALLFSLIALSVVDKVAGYHRTKLPKGYLSRVSKIMEARKQARQTSQVKEDFEGDIEETLKNVSQDDCVILVEKMLHFHQIDDKLKGNLKLYSVTTVHAFAQFQSVLFHAIHLNGLLNFPLQQCRPAKMFSGTLVYNAYANFKKRPNVSGYIESLLGSGRSVCELYKKISLQVLEMLTEVNVLRRKGNKRKKRPHGKEISDVVGDLLAESGEKSVDTYCDMNNKFYALELLNDS